MEYDLSIDYTLEKETQINDKVDDRFSRVDNKTGKPTELSMQQQIMWRKYYLQVVLNMMIPIYGFAVMML